MLTALMWKTGYKDSIDSWSSLAVQWLGLPCFHCREWGLIPGWGTKISLDMQCAEEVKKKKKRCYDSKRSVLILNFAGLNFYIG